MKAETFMDDMNEIDESRYDGRDAFGAHLAEAAQEDREIVFCKELCVAMEKIKDGSSLESLRIVLPAKLNKKAV